MDTSIYFKNKLETIPHKCGCYLLKNQETIIYIGKAKDLFNRVNSYFSGVHNIKTSLLVMEVTDFDYIIVSNEKEAFILENNLIKKHIPKYNVLLVDDKTYPYLQVTNERYPRLELTRTVDKQNSNIFGPYPPGYSAHTFYQVLSDIFPFRKCKKMPSKVCLYYHLNKCLGPCVNKDVSYEQTLLNLKTILKGDIKDIIQNLTDLMLHESNNLNYELAQKYKEAIDSIQKSILKQSVEINKKENIDFLTYVYDENFLCLNILIVRNGLLIDNFSIVYSYIDSYISLLNTIVSKYYEDKSNLEIIVFNKIDFSDFAEVKPATIKLFQSFKGQKMNLLQMSLENAKNTLTNNNLLNLSKDDFHFNALNKLSEIIGYYPNHIEVFDNAHLFGVDLVSSCIVFKDKQLQRKEYRKFHLKSHSTTDDLKSISEVIYRRITRLLLQDQQLPELIIVDGGKNQVTAANKILLELNQKILVIGLVKNDSHNLRALIVNENEIIIDKNSSLYKFLSFLSEEVHRFTITFHRSSRQKNNKMGLLDSIKGIGDMTKKKILLNFESISDIENAPVEKLKKLGLSTKQITNLKESLKYYD